MNTQTCERLGLFATILGEDPVRFETSLEQDECEKMWFVASSPIDLGALAKIESDDTLWMGVIDACSKEGEVWRVEIRVEHILRNVRELSDLAARFE